jgi:hypothetical protein
MLEIEKDIEKFLLNNCNKTEQNCSIPTNLNVVDNISSTI